MSRIGKAPIQIPQGVSINVSADNVVTVKGPKGETQQAVDSRISCAVEEDQLILKRSSEEKEVKARHGLYRSLLKNMVEGVNTGFQVKQELVGVGYRAKATGQQLELALGYSHPIILQLPDEVSVTAETAKGQNPIITLQSHDKQLLGQVAAKIRSFRKPEPYKGKGIKFVGEQLRRKAGKAAGK